MDLFQDRNQTLSLYTRLAFFKLKKKKKVHSYWRQIITSPLTEMSIYFQSVFTFVLQPDSEETLTAGIKSNTKV